MTIHEEAFKQAEKELKEDHVKEIKEIMKSILQEMQHQKEIKEAAEEKLRILKMEMEDLKEGRIDKIKERHDKSKKVGQISPIKLPNLFSTLNKLPQYGTLTTTGTGNSGEGYTFTNAGSSSSLGSLFSGVYTVTCSNNSTKEFYL